VKDDGMGISLKDQ